MRYRHRIFSDVARSPLWFACLLVVVFLLSPGSAFADGVRARFLIPPWPGGWTNMSNAERQTATIEVQGAEAGATLAIVAATGITPESTPDEITARLERAVVLSGSESTIPGDGELLIEGIYPPGVVMYYQLWIMVDNRPALSWEGETPAPGDLWVLWGQTGYEGPRLLLTADLVPGPDSTGVAGDIGLTIGNEPREVWSWRTGYRWALQQDGVLAGDVHNFDAGIISLQGEHAGDAYGAPNPVAAELPAQWDWPSGGGELTLRVGRWDESTGHFADPEEGEFGATGPEVVLHGACAAPAVPADLAGTPGNSITVSWDIVPGANGYLVRYGNVQLGYLVEETETHSFSFQAQGGESYEIRVRAWSACGNGWRVFGEKSESITVQSDEEIVVSLDVPTASALPGVPVSFTNASTITGLDPGSVAFVLDFGDGGSATPGVGESVEHAYTTGGVYAATLSANWTGGSGSDSEQLLISSPLKVSISASPGPVSNGKRSYTFTAVPALSVEPLPDTYTWTFNGEPAGEGSSFSTEIPLSESFDLSLTAARSTPFDDSCVTRLHGVAAGDTTRKVEDELKGEEPAAFSYVVAAAARVAGEAGARWYSDLAVLNPPGNGSTSLRLYFLNQGNDNTESTGRELELPAGNSLYIQDVVAGLFGLNGSFGAVLVASDVPILISSRIYDGGGAGTFGQYLGGQPSISGRISRERSRLIQLAQSDVFRTNVGLVNLQGILLEKNKLGMNGYDAGGQELALKNGVDVPPFSMKQISKVFADDSEDAVLELGYAPGGFPSPGSLSRPMLIYASVVDNTSNDPTTVTPVLPITPESPGIISVVARLNGASGTVWRSDVELHNPGDVRAVYELRFGSEERNGSLDPGKSVRYADVLGTLFGLDSGAKGRLELRVSSGEVLASSRTYNETAEGTFGQFIPAIPTWAAARRGDSLYSTQIVENSDFRSNIGFANTTAVDVDLVLRLYGRDGAAAGSVERRLPAGITKQWTVASLFGVEDFIGWLEAEISQGAGVHEQEPSVLGYLSLVDNITGDPTYIPLAPLRPVADFSWNPGNPVSGGEVRLIDRSLGYPSAWHWTVSNNEGDEILDTTDRDPSFIPDTGGDYEITLRLDEGAAFPATVTKLIHVAPVEIGVPTLSIGSVSSSSIELQWTPIPDADGYQYHRRSGDENFDSWRNIDAVCTPMSHRCSFIDENLNAGGEYCYELRVHEGSEYGNASNEACAETGTNP